MARLEKSASAIRARNIAELLGMGTPWASGANYQIAVLPRRLVVCSVWKRPDLTRMAGAACAEEKVAHFRQLARTHRSLILDLTAAPETWGPATQASLERMLEPWATSGLRVCVIAVEAIQRIAVAKLLAAVALPPDGLVSSVEESLERVSARL